jgi:NADPH:quinone reductase-like Zn-dependent oxidoreductase
MGAQVIAGVRKNQLQDAALLDVHGVVAVDDDDAIANLALVDAVADTVGGDVAARLMKRVKQGGAFGYASVIPPGTEGLYPTVNVKRVFAQPDPPKLREFADDMRDGKFILPIGRRLPLRNAAEAHALGEKGGAGKIVLLVEGA